MQTTRKPLSNVVSKIIDLFYPQLWKNTTPSPRILTDFKKGTFSRTPQIRPSCDQAVVGIQKVR